MVLKIDFLIILLIKQVKQMNETSHYEMLLHCNTL